MGFLKMNWLRKLWGVQEVPTTVAPPIDCAGCRDARSRGLDACDVHHNAHPRAHTYDFGHEVSWGSPLSMSNDQMPIRNSESIH